MVDAFSRLRGALVEHLCNTLLRPLWRKSLLDSVLLASLQKLLYEMVGGIRLDLRVMQAQRFRSGVCLSCARRCDGSQRESVGCLQEARC